MRHEAVPFGQRHSLNCIRCRLMSVSRHRVLTKVSDKAIMESALDVLICVRLTSEAAAARSARTLRVQLSAQRVNLDLSHTALLSSVSSVVRRHKPISHSTVFHRWTMLILR